MHPEDVLRRAELVIRSVNARRLLPDEWDRFQAFLVSMQDAVDRRDLVGISTAAGTVMELSGRRHNRRIDTERVTAPEPVRTTAEKLSKELAELARKYDK